MNTTTRTVFRSATCDDCYPIAHQQAAERGFSELSLLCFEQNAIALKLYQRYGFSVIDRNRIVPHPLIHHTGDVLLMTAPVRV